MPHESIRTISSVEAKPDSVYVDMPRGVAELSPNLYGIQNFVAQRANDLEIPIKDDQIGRLKIIQTAEALKSQMIVAEIDKLDIESRLAIEGFTLSRSFLPNLHEYVLTAFPLSQPFIFLNAQKVAKAGVKAVYRVGSNAEDLTLTAVNQYLNYQLEQAVDNWIRLADPRSPARVGNFAKAAVSDLASIMVSTIVTKSLTGVIPVALLANAYTTGNYEALVEGALLVGSLGGLVKTAQGIHKKLVNGGPKEAEYLNRPLFNIDF